MPLVKQNTTTYIRSLKITHIAMCASILVFAVTCFIMVNSGTFIPQPLMEGPVALGACAGFAVLMLLLAQMVYARKLKSIPQQKNLQDKSKAYRQAVIIRLMLLDFGAMAAVVCFMLTGYPLLLIIPVAMVLLILYGLPNKNKMIQAFQPDFNEMNLLEDPNTIISTMRYSRR